MRGMPKFMTLNEATKDYKKVVIFVDFNNAAKGMYYPDTMEMIVNSIIQNNGQIPSILIGEWIKYQTYLETWAKTFKKDLKCVYFSEHGNSFYHVNIYKEYKAKRAAHRNIVIPTGLLSYFDNDVMRVQEVLSWFLNSTWEWISRLASMSNISTFRLSNLDADFIPEYLFRKVKGFYNEDTCYIIFSSDGDMIQLLDFGPNVKIIDSETIIDENNWMVSKKYLENSLGRIKKFIRADRILLYKSTVGDKSDNISGVPKLGAKGFAHDLVYLPEEIDCDDIQALKKYFESATKNPSIEKILLHWDKFETCLKLTSFKILIEFLYHTPSRNDLLTKMIQENRTSLENYASLQSLTHDKELEII